MQIVGIKAMKIDKKTNIGFVKLPFNFEVSNV
jgi:hypothetical protein